MRAVSHLLGIKAAGTARATYCLNGKTEVGRLSDLLMKNKIIVLSSALDLALSIDKTIHI